MGKLHPQIGTELHLAAAAFEIKHKMPVELKCDDAAVVLFEQGQRQIDPGEDARATVGVAVQQAGRPQSESAGAD